MQKDYFDDIHKYVDERISDTRKSDLIDDLILRVIKRTMRNFHRLVAYPKKFDGITSEFVMDAKSEICIIFHDALILDSTTNNKKCLLFPEEK